MAIGKRVIGGEKRSLLRCVRFWSFRAPWDYQSGDGLRQTGLYSKLGGEHLTLLKEGGLQYSQFIVALPHRSL